MGTIDDLNKSEIFNDLVRHYYEAMFARHKDTCGLKQDWQCTCGVKPDTRDGMQQAARDKAKKELGL